LERHAAPAGSSRGPGARRVGRGATAAAAEGSAGPLQGGGGDGGGGGGHMRAESPQSPLASADAARMRAVSADEHSCVRTAPQKTVPVVRQKTVPVLPEPLAGAEKVEAATLKDVPDAAALEAWLKA
ncbi:unnamed protein product, partial [Prorocentrum cordatum]